MPIQGAVAKSPSLRQISAGFGAAALEAEAYMLIVSYSFRRPSAWHPRSEIGQWRLRRAERSWWSSGVRKSDVRYKGPVYSQLDAIRPVKDKRAEVTRTGPNIGFSSESYRYKKGGDATTVGSAPRGTPFCAPSKR